jgi:hypothetical protein
MPYMTPGFPHLPCPCIIFSVILLSTMDSHLHATGLGASHQVIRDENRVGPWLNVDSLRADWASRVEWPPNGQDEKEIQAYFEVTLRRAMGRGTVTAAAYSMNRSTNLLPKYVKMVDQQTLDAISMERLSCASCSTRAPSYSP